MSGDKYLHSHFREFYKNFNHCLRQVWIKICFWLIPKQHTSMS